MSRSSLIVLAVSLVFSAYVLWMARRHRTAERHTFAWLLFAVTVAVLAVWRPAIDAIADAMGIYYAPSALFLVTTGGALWLIYRLSLEVVEQRRRIQRLAQELAILSAAVARQEAPASAAHVPGTKDARKVRAG